MKTTLIYVRRWQRRWHWQEKSPTLRTSRMDNNWLKLAGVVVVVVLGFVGYRLLGKSYAPVVVAGETYTHVEMTEVNKVQNHFFTLNGTDVDDSDRFVQISKYDHPDLTPDQVRVVQQQVIQTDRLQPIEGYDDRFFGVSGTVPIYGYMGTAAFVLKVGPKTADLEEAELAAEAMTDALSRVPTAL
jgi:hypothetical protein